MKIKVRNDNVEISGYVNIPERVSKKLTEHGNTFYEKISEGAFSEAISRNNNIKLLLNHKMDRELANTNNSLKLYEDNVGLFASARVYDKEVVEKARSGNLVGWSFGFSALKENSDNNYQNYPLRCVECLNLYEVSVLDSNHIPAYNSMSLQVREFGNNTMEIRAYKDLKVEVDEDEEDDITDKEDDINEKDDINEQGDVDEEDVDEDDDKENKKRSFDNSKFLNKINTFMEARK